MKKNKLIILTLFALILTSCAHTLNIEKCLPNSEPLGFWYGVWHGMIVQFSFIVSLFSDNITIYDVNNNGAWYNFGFVFGIGWVIRFMIKLVLRIIKIFTNKIK